MGGCSSCTARAVLSSSSSSSSSGLVTSNLADATEPRPPLKPRAAEPTSQPSQLQGQQSNAWSRQKSVPHRYLAAMGKALDEDDEEKERTAAEEQAEEKRGEADDGGEANSAGRARGGRMDELSALSSKYRAGDKVASVRKSAIVGLSQTTTAKERKAEPSTPASVVSTSAERRHEDEDDGVDDSAVREAVSALLGAPLRNAIASRPATTHRFSALCVSVCARVCVARVLPTAGVSASGRLCGAVLVQSVRQRRGLSSAHSPR